MIRPVLYVDLPGIVYALDQRARARRGEFADFVIAPRFEEPRSGVAALLSALWPIAPHALTWICEDRWHLLGLAQARTRPGAQAWDLTYLAAMTAPGGQPPTTPAEEVLLELVQYALNAAITRGIHRFFARMDDERPELDLFSRMSFQRYARELSYWLPCADQQHAACAEEPATATTPTRVRPHSGPLALLNRARAVQPSEPLRAWQQHDAWGLLRLYDASTPRRVQVAEGLNTDELLHTRAGGGRTWYLPFVEPGCVAFVLDRGVRLGGWLRLRFGRGSQPHQLWVMAHPDDPDVPRMLVRTGVRLLAQQGSRPVLCQVREYEGHIVEALRAEGFAHAGTEALLVRHLTMRALRHRDVPAFEPRVLYGVRGFGTTHTRLSKGEKNQYGTSDH
jgi:hypothetical protein